MDFEIKFDHILNGKPYKADEAMDHEIVSDVKILPLFIDLHTYKGLIYISNSKIILESDVIESEISVDYEIGSIKTFKKISKRKK